MRPTDESFLPVDYSHFINSCRFMACTGYLRGDPLTLPLWKRRSLWWATVGFDHYGDNHLQKCCLGGEPEGKRFGELFVMLINSLIHLFASVASGIAALVIRFRTFRFRVRRPRIWCHHVLLLWSLHVQIFCNYGSLRLLTSSFPGLWYSIFKCCGYLWWWKPPLHRGYFTPC